MTHPGDGEFSPDGGLGPGGLGLSFSALQSKTEEEWREEQNSDVLSHFVNIPFVIGIINELVEVLTGVEDGDSGDVASWVNLLLGRDESLASRVARIENKIALGAEFFDDFNRGDNDTTLGNGWVQGGAGQPLGIHDQAAQIKRDLLPDDDTRYAICPQVADGDDFTVSMVVHPAGVSANPETVLYARMNAAFTAGVCVRMRSGLTRISRVTGRSGGNFSYTDIGPPGTKFYSNSATIEFKGSGTALQVVIDGVLVVDTTDGVHTIGAANRTVGFSAQCWTALAAIPQYSGGLASFAMRSSVELTAVQQAQATASSAASTAATAQSTATTAQSTATAAESTAMTAASDAAVAASDAAVALDIASYWEAEAVVASAAVVLGYNELLIGLNQPVPAGKTRTIDKITFALQSKAGTMTIETRKWNAARSSYSTVHTANLSAGQINYEASVSVSVSNGERVNWYVTASSDTAVALHAQVSGTIL